MIRVAFWYDRPLEYTGGLNYIRNLLHAIAAVNDGSVVPYVFFGSKTDSKVLQQFASLATVVRTPILDRLSPAWFVHRLLFKKMGSMWLVERLLNKWGIDVVSHAEHLYGSRRSFHSIYWIPDFQYLHLPELFPGLDVAAETERLRAIVAAADLVVLSSRAALQDFLSIAPQSAARARVLQFVSQPSAALGTSAGRDRSIDASYGIEDRYFYLPNQFWRHKNHQVVFDTVRLLRQRGENVQVLCTGNLKDYRLGGTQYAEGLQRFIRDHQLERHIKILGLIPYEHVLYLMRHCVAVINPSRFEGWSSTVEEARSLGQRLVLSNIAVHLEQDPPGARYFAPDDAAGLADVLAELWEAAAAGGDDDPARRQEHASISLQERTAAYGRGFLELVKGLANTSAAACPVADDTP